MNIDNLNLARNIYDNNPFHREEYPDFENTPDDVKIGWLLMNNPEQAIYEYKQLGRKSRYVTAMCYPNKMTCEEFFDDLIAHKDSFIKNMKGLGRDSEFAEIWIGTLAAWIEMEEGDFD